MSWFREIIELQHEAREPQEFMESLKLDLFSDLGLCVYAERRCYRAAGRLGAARFCLSDSHRSRKPDDWGEG